VRWWVEVLVDIAVLLTLIAIGQNMDAPIWLIAMACLAAVIILLG